MSNTGRAGQGSPRRVAAEADRPAVDDRRNRPPGACYEGLKGISDRQEALSALRFTRPVPLGSTRRSVPKSNSALGACNSLLRQRLK
jgi:hypothetical protein